jgi:hypothetical protein
VLLCAPYQGCWVLLLSLRLLLAKSGPQALGTGGAGGDRFGVWVCFEEEQSDTYAEQEVGTCPE